MSQKAQPPEELGFGEWGSGICLVATCANPFLATPSPQVMDAASGTVFLCARNNNTGALAAAGIIYYPV